MKSLSASNNITDSETIENTAGKGTVTTVTTEQSSTGVTVALEDAERNPITSVALTGGYLDPSTGKFTQKKSGVSAPEIGLLVFSKTFGAGNFGIGGNEGISMTIYPSNTAIKTTWIRVKANLITIPMTSQQVMDGKLKLTLVFIGTKTSPIYTELLLT